MKTKETKKLKESQANNRQSRNNEHQYNQELQTKQDNQENQEHQTKYILIQNTRETTHEKQTLRKHHLPNMPSSSLVWDGHIENLGSYRLFVCKSLFLVGEFFQG